MRKPASRGSKSAPRSALPGQVAFECKGSGANLKIKLRTDYTFLCDHNAAGDLIHKMQEAHDASKRAIADKEPAWADGTFDETKGDLIDCIEEEKNRNRGALPACTERSVERGVL
jgi:hypothetical protein